MAKKKLPLSSGRGLKKRHSFHASKEFNVIGLMSGTSLDGVDAALLLTDGKKVLRRGNFISLNYPETFRAKLRQGLTIAKKARKKQRNKFFNDLEFELTEYHARAVFSCLKANILQSKDVDLLGFHGQTMVHVPKRGFSWQLGDGQYLARLTNIDAVTDFRANDLRHGGQGAPFVPLYHRTLFEEFLFKQPIAVVNIGGVSNVTWLWKDRILAFDCGPGNALCDDWILTKTGLPFDEGGKIARRGQFEANILRKWLTHSYFNTLPPKSLDRDTYSINKIKKLTTEDGAATLSRFTVEAIVKAQDYFPEKTQLWIITGGGRHNLFLLNSLRKCLKAKVFPIETYGFNGDAIEAEAFAFLAVRSIKNLPLSMPSTTGVRRPISGGRLFSFRPQ